MKREAFLVCALLCFGCSSEDAAGAGSVSFETWGEDYIEQGIGSEQFEDGWSVHYDQFLINLGQFRIASSAGETAATLPTSQLFDMTRPGPQPVAEVHDLEARKWDRVSFAIAPADASTSTTANTTEADLDMMRQGGYSVLVRGTATDGTTQKSFAWGFPCTTTYGECHAELDGKETDGVIVTNGGNDTVQVTIHGDHFFYDDLASPAAVLRFAPLAAADADQDGEVTLAELSAVKLFEVDVGTYGTGAANIDDLGAYVSALSSTIGHYRGEGMAMVEAAS